MKRTSKKILGILALAVVAVITVVAAFIPNPGASALETSPVTDQITVRVVGSTPKILISSPDDDAIYIEPDQILKFSFENVETTTTRVYYTDKDGAENIYTIDTLDPDYNPGDSGDIPLDLSVSPYGYGKYTIAVTGEGFDGVTSEDTVSFAYYPVYGEVTEDPDNGLFYLDLYYDDENEDIDHITIEVYDGDKRIDTLTAEVEPGENRVELPFAAKGLPSGNYTVKITAYDEDGEELYNPYATDVDFAITPSPDTGAFFKNINVAQSDLIITGLVVFVAAATIASVLIVRNKKVAKKEEEK